MACGGGGGEGIIRLFLKLLRNMKQVSFNTVESIARTELSYIAPKTLVATLFDKCFQEYEEKCAMLKFSCFISNLRLKRSIGNCSRGQI